MREVITKEILERLYVGEKKTDIEISEILSVDRAAVTVARRRHGIKAIREWERKNLPLLTNDQLSLIDGSILGDGSIERSHSHSCSLSFGHSTPQHSYAGLKAGMLGEYLSNVRVDRKGMMRVCSIVHPVFEWYREECYVEHNGKMNKRIPQFILNRLNPLSMAIWYCDDGCQSRNQVWFCVGCPIEEERQNAMEILSSKFGLTCSVCKMTGEECWRIYVWKKSQEKFFDLIGNFVSIAIPYKIPEWYRIRHANQQPSLEGNLEEGSTTGESLNSQEHGGNSHLAEETQQDMPGNSVKELVIQSELMGDYERKAETSFPPDKHQVLSNRMDSAVTTASGLHVGGLITGSPINSVNCWNSMGIIPHQMRHANQQPSEIGNDFEGSETMDEAKGSTTNASNVQPIEGNLVGTPSIRKDEDIVRTMANLREPLIAVETSATV